MMKILKRKKKLVKCKNCPKVKMTDVHKHFGDNKVLNGVSVSVARGESLVIIGGSGTGKSVTIKSILGLLEPDTGIIEIDGMDTSLMTSKDRVDQC